RYPEMSRGLGDVYKSQGRGSEAEKNGAFNLYRMSNISEIDGNVLKEKHLISADLLESPYGAAIIDDSETRSIMVNEEDHIRAQCILPGFRLLDAYDSVNQLDDVIAGEVTYAYDKKFGYLTACPTNVGTGMRASAMMFLPGLSLTHNLENCVRTVARFNMAIRGVYGEGSEAEGLLYQISNQKTLGVSEHDILSSVQASIGHIADAELHAREALLASGGSELRDKIQRAYGILCNAYKLNTQEFMSLLALVKLGVYYGILKVSDPLRLEKLVTEGQPANVLNLSGKELDAAGRDIFRALYVSKTLKNICKR
ncbi:MAG: ATP--guanido phosphotransferase, partial [Clostridiales bacterium]|nr:ATP--guanido phosphotransferase [Clostridiales bacterium]